MSLVAKGRVIENSPAVLRRRVTTTNETTYLTQAATTSISIKVFDASTGLQSGSTQSPSVSSTVYDTLQTWPDDTTGFNLALSLPGTVWPEAGTYNVECLVTPVSGSPFYLLWQVQAVNIFSA